MERNMLKERAKKYYLQENRNCAEAVLMAANEVYGLDIPPESIAMIGGFGGGMGCGGVCGALSGAVAAVGKRVIETKAHDTEGLSETCAALVEDFEKELGSTLCTELKAKYKTEDQRCAETVERAADVLERCMAKLAGESTEECVTVSPEDIKRVKAFGFLHCKGTDRFNGRIITRNGKITAAESKCISEAAQKFGNGELAMTTRLTIEVQGIPYNQIEPFRAYVAQEGLYTGGTGSKVRPVVSCKGTTCQYGLIDTFALSEELHRRFFEGYSQVKLPHKFKIAVGGCPNNCVKPDLNDLGIIGQRAPQLDEDLCRGCTKCVTAAACPISASALSEGKLSFGDDCNSCGRCIGKCPFHALENGAAGYKIYIGGRWGKKTAEGHALSRRFTSEQEVYDVVEKAILLFREQGETGERFADTIARIGFDEVERQLLGNELLERKAEILGAELHLVGDATC